MGTQRLEEKVHLEDFQKKILVKLHEIRRSNVASRGSNTNTLETNHAFSGVYSYLVNREGFKTEDQFEQRFTIVFEQRF